MVLSLTAVTLADSPLMEKIMRIRTFSILYVVAVFMACGGDNSPSADADTSTPDTNVDETDLGIDVSTDTTADTSTDVSDDSDATTEDVRDTSEDPDMADTGDADVTEALEDADASEDAEADIRPDTDTGDSDVAVSDATVDFASAHAGAEATRRYAYASGEELLTGTWSMKANKSAMALEEYCFLVEATHTAFVATYVEQLRLRDGSGTLIADQHPTPDGTFCFDGFEYILERDMLSSLSVEMIFTATEDVPMEHPGTRVRLVPTSARFDVLDTGEELTLTGLEAYPGNDIIVYDTFPSSMYIDGPPAPTLHSGERMLFQVTLYHDWPCTTDATRCGGVGEVFISTTPSTPGLIGTDESRIGSLEVRDASEDILAGAIAYMHTSGEGIVIQLPEGFYSFDAEFSTFYSFQVHALVSRVEDEDAITFEIPPEQTLDTGSEDRRFAGPSTYEGEDVVWAYVFQNAGTWFGGTVPDAGEFGSVTLGAR